MKLGLFLLFLPLLLKAQDPYEYLYCEADKCYKNVFSEISTLSDSVKKIYDYWAKEHFDHYQNYKNNLDRRNITPSLAFYLQAEALRDFLQECEFLLGASKMQGPIHLILSGHEFYGDGQNFSLAAESYKQDLIRKNCPDKNEDCIKRHIHFSDMSKERFHIILEILPAGSIASLTIFAHGTEKLINIGPKNLLLPSMWSPDLNISKEEWIQLSFGGLYTEDFSGDSSSLSSLLTQKFSPNSTISIYSCNSADGDDSIARQISNVSQNSTVSACRGGMNFIYTEPETNKVQTNFSTPVPFHSKNVQLIPRHKEDWVTIKDGQSANGLTRHFNLLDETVRLVGNETVNDSLEQMSDKILLTPQEQVAKQIVLRLLTGGANEVEIEKDGKKRIMYFTLDEVRELKKLVGYYDISFGAFYNSSVNTKCLFKKEACQSKTEFSQNVIKKVVELSDYAYKRYYAKEN